MTASSSHTMVSWRPRHPSEAKKIRATIATTSHPLESGGGPERPAIRGDCRGRAIRETRNQGVTRDNLSGSDPQSGGTAAGSADETPSSGGPSERPATRVDGRGQGRQRDNSTAMEDGRCGPDATPSSAAAIRGDGDPPPRHQDAILWSLEGDPTDQRSGRTAAAGGIPRLLRAAGKTVGGVT